MPELCRVGVCGFDPMLVKGYVQTGFRALWWHISDEVYEEYNAKPNSTISGKLLKVFDGKDGKVQNEPKEAFEWNMSKESGLAVLLPADVIVKYELTETKFIEVLVEKIDGQDVYSGEEKMSTKYWPEEKMDLDFVLEFIAP